MRHSSNIPNASAAASQGSPQGGSFSSNPGGQGNVSNAGMVNPFSQQQMLQQKQRQMMGGNIGTNNSPMSNLTNMAHGNTTSNMGAANSASQAEAIGQSEQAGTVTPKQGFI